MARTPLEHQVTGIDFLKSNTGCILADTMGLGKSYQATQAAHDLTGGGVVICPATLKVNWAREILEVDDDAHVVILDGSNVYEYHQGDGTQWLIVNYDILERADIQKKVLWLQGTTLILDEAHYIKSKTAKRTKAVLKLVDSFKHVFELTGTPVMNRPEELFSLLAALKHPLADNWYSYVYRYCAAHKVEFSRIEKDDHGRIVFDERGNPKRRKYSFLNTSGASNLDELAEKLKPIYLRRTKEVLGDKLPAKVITNVEVDIADEWRKKYHSTWDDYLEYLRNAPEGTQGTSISNAQMAQHIIELGKLKQVASLAKIDRVVADVANVVEQGEKVIVFTQYSETIKRVVAELKAKKIKTVKIDGSDNLQSRQKAVDAIQEGDAMVLVGNIKAAGTGLNLFAASQVRFIDMEWTPALHDQAEDRAHRYGQKRQVNVYYYIAKDTVDEDIVELLEKKSQIIKAILEGETSSTKDITKDAIKRIIEKQALYTGTAAWPYLLQHL